MKRALAWLAWSCLAGLAFVQAGLAGTLVVSTNASDPAPRAAWEAVVARFRASRPDLDVRLTVYDHESYKKALRNWLTSAAPDVVFWFAGNRMRELAGPGLLLDVSDLFTPAVKAELGDAAVELVSIGERQFGVPYTHYQLGLYFRRDLFESAGAGPPPRRWEDLLAVCEKLKALGLEPIAIGSRDLWPTAAWFDYLDLRLNGFAFHMELMNGRVPYTDARVRQVFARWRELLDRNCFAKNHASLSWQESQSLLYRGRSAMMLIGNYIVPNFPPEIRDRMAFARFPTIAPEAGAAEDAPMNTLHVPANARNPEDAKDFLRFVLRSDVQEEINRTLLQIPVSRRAKVADDPFLRAGQELLAGAEHLAQFFDRDTNEELATIAMKGFQEFMLRPERLDAILQTIETARQRIYRP